MPEITKFELRQPISPYTCSTPLDFSEERQHLSEVIFPQLDDFCKNRGSYFSPVDVRWKPGDSKTQGGLLLKTQLDFIKKCSPFFIGLLGETYGPYRNDSDPQLSLPRNRANLELPENWNWLDKNLLLAATGGHPWVLQEGHQTSSVSELEVTQACLLGDSQHVTLYYRQSDHLDDKLQDLHGSGRDSEKEDVINLYSSESDHAKMKIHDLRQRLVNKGVTVKYFKTVKELGQLVLEDWLEVIDIVLPPLPYREKLLDTFEYKEWLAQESFISNRSTPFVSGTDVEETLQQLTDFALTCSRAEVRGDIDDIFGLLGTDSKVQSSSASEMFKKCPPPTNQIKSVLVLNGDRGVGKSALAAHWLNEFRAENAHLCVIAHFVSASNNSADVVDFLHHCIGQLRKEYLLSDDYDAHSICAEIEEESEKDGKNFQSLCEVFVAALGLGPCVILLDGLNEFSSSPDITAQEVKEFTWLSETLPPTCKFIVTTTRSDISYRCLAKRQDVVTVNVPVSLANVTSTVAMVKEHQPTISQLLAGENAVKKLANLKIMQTALGSRVVGSEVSCYRVYKNMGAFMENCTEIWSLRDFWIMCVQNWVKEHSWTTEFPASEVNFVDSGFDYAGWVTDCLCLIAVSRNGLTQDQILAILKMIGYEGDLEVTVYDWLQFRLAASATFHELADGRLVFGHRYLQEIAEYLLFKSFSSVSYDPVTIMKSVRSEKRQCYHSHLARFFSQQLIDTQVMDELPWQLMLSGNIVCLMDYLTDCGALLKMLTAQSKQWQQDLKLYWSVCQQEGHHPGSVYLQLTNALGVVDINDVQMLDDSCSQISSPAPRVVVSTPQLLDYDDEDEIDVSRTGSLGDLQSIPLAENGKDNAVKRKISEEPVGKDFADSIFVTQGGGSGDKGFPSHALHVNESDKSNFPGVATLCWHIAKFLQDLGQTEASRILLSSLVSYIKHNYPLSLDQHLLLSRCHHAIGNIYEINGDLVAGEKEYKQALHAVVAAEDMDDDLRSQEQIRYLKGLLLSCHGNLRVQEDELFEAEELLKEALECVEENRDCFVLKSTIYHNLALLRASQADFLRAESCLRESCKLRSLWFGRCHPLVAQSLVALAKLLATPSNVKGQDVSQSEALFRNALVILEKCLGVSHPSVAGVLFDLGELLAEDKSHPAKVEAQKFLGRSLDIRTTELGGHHPVTMATQQSLTRLEVALKLGLYEFGSGKLSDRRSNNSTPFSALTFRESDLSRLQSRMNSQSTLRIEDPMSVRAVSRDEVLRHNRPDSILSSVVSLTSASERLLSAPVSEQPRLLRREKENRLHQPIRPSQKGLDDIDDRKQEFVIIGSLDSKGRRVIVGDDLGQSELDDGEMLKSGSFVSQGESGAYENRPEDAHLDENEGDSKRQEILVDIKQQVEGEKQTDTGSIEVLDTPHLESYADITSKQAVSGEKKAVTIRPSSAPRRMFQRYGSAKAAATPAPSAPKPESSHRSWRMWSGRSNATVASTTSGHHSRCSIPGRYDLTASNSHTITGPHSSLVSILGDPPCPRPSSNTIHHRSAWYHVPGRYTTPQERYPKKRMQKTENAKDIEAFISLKSQWANKKREEIQRAKLKAQQQEQEQSQSKSPNRMGNTTKLRGAGPPYTGPTSFAYNRFGSHQRLLMKSSQTPRLMISGLDIVPESRYPDSHQPSTNHVVKFKEPVIVG